MSKIMFKLIACVLTVSALLTFTPAAKAETTTETWMNMVQSLAEDIDEQQKLVEDLSRYAPEMIRHFDARMLTAQNRLDQLKVLRGLAKRTPWSYRTVLMQLDDVRAYVLRAKTELLIEKNRLKKIKKDFDVLSGIHFKSRLTDDRLKLLLEKTKEKYIEVRENAAELKKNLDSALARSDELLANTESNREATSGYYAQSLRDYYFEPGLSLLSSTSWPDIKYSFDDWKHNYAKFYHPLIVWVHWGDFLTYLAIITIGLWLFLRQGVKRLLRRPAFGDHGLSCYNFGLIMISLGIGMYIARSVTLFTSNQITGLLWSEAITLGIITCARNFLWAREKTKPTPLIYSPMFTLWCLMTAGDFMHIMTLPMDCIGVVWFFLSLAGFAFMQINRHKFRLGITRSTSKANRTVLAAGCLISLFGFGTQAMILTQLWFMLLITLQICSALKMIMVTDRIPEAIPAVPASEEEQEKPDEEQLLKQEESRQQARRYNQMVQLFYPLSVSIIIFLFLCWTTAYMGGIPFAHFVFRHMDVNIAGADISLKSLFYIMILFFSSRLVLFWLKSFVTNTSIGGRKIESSLAHTFSTIGSYIVWVVFLLSSFFLMGIPMSALTWIASGLSIGIGFGLKDIVSNFVSGLIILFGGSIKKGDTLQYKKMIGKVVDVSIRNTTIKTLDNSMIIIPNSSFLKGEIINLNYQDTRIRVTLPLTLVPGSKIKKATKIIMKVVRKHPRVLSEPEPEVFFKRFGTFGLDFEIYFWVNCFEDQYRTESEIMNELDEKFQGKKIKVAFRTIKTKYKPLGDEAAQIAAQREALKEKRRLYGKCFRSAALRKHRTLNKIELDTPE
ncbi:mechanosensitive ion channel domain-containing protein [Maridesulfovibrio sp.]|uniref:mechanosensitive ion channel family protein n=1 Tax=Maridesulfovibrio sp. TaxID=2795000 RepID=UPI002A18C854|nr:mechanosensitive ion channel domain-containing protein [Maridesulfovibrio sp.]